MKNYRKRYAGRLIDVCLDGGWSFYGKIELNLSTKDIMVLDFSGDYIEIPICKIVAVKLNNAKVINQKVHPVPQGNIYDQERFNFCEPDPEVIAATKNMENIAQIIRSGSRAKNKDIGITTLEKLELASMGIENGVGNENQYGSIIPGDMLSSIEDSSYVNLSMTTDGFKNASQGANSWFTTEEEAENGSE